MKALVLGGGGSRGAFQVGCLKALYELGRLDRVETVYGTSVGAFNSLFSAVGIKELERQWRSIRNRSDVLNSYWVSWLWKGALYGKKPLRKYVEKKLLKEALSFQKQTKVVAVDKVSGAMEVGVSNQHSARDMVQHILGSLSIPVIIEDEKGLVDGGVREMSCIGRAIEDGHKEILAIANTPTNEPYGPIRHFKLPILTNMVRTVELMEQEIFYNDYNLAQFACSAVNITLIEPPYSLGSNFDWTQSTISKQIDQGYNLTLQRFKNAK